MILPLLISLALLALAVIPRLLDPGVLLDNTRQYGPPLVAALQGNGWLAAQPQIAYFHDALPRLHGLLVEGLCHLASLSVFQASKLLALLLLLPLAAVVGRLSTVLWKSKEVAGTFSVLLFANLIFSNQALTGTPRDLGAVLFLALLVSLLERRWLWVVSLLVPLAGIYPTFGLLGLAVVWLAVGAGAAVPALRRRGFAAPGAGLATLVFSLPAVGLGLKLLGPQISARTWGPTLRLFDQQPFDSLLPLIRANAPGGLGPSVGSLIGFRPTPAHLLELLGDKRFRLLPASGQHALGWLGSPLSILLVAVAIGLGSLLLQRGRSQRLALQEGLLQGLALRQPGWTVCVALSLVVAALGLYGLSFALAFALHDPNRYTTMAAALLLSLVELALLRWLVQALLRGSGQGQRGLAALPLVLAVALPLLRSPVDLQSIPATTIAAVAAQVSARSAQVMAVQTGNEEELEAVINALPLVQGVRVFYAPEMDRGFHREAIRQGQELRLRQHQLTQDVLELRPDLGARLRQNGITHLLGAGERLEPLASPPACLTRLPGSLALLDVACSEDTR